MDFSFNFTNAQWVTFVLMCLFAAINMWFFLFYFIKVALWKNKSPENIKNKGVSIIISARNELENLKVNIPLILAQNHPDFEVIIVNDGSWDGSEDLLREMEANHSNLKCIHLNHEFLNARGKKFALTMGIKAATKDYILLTDADCIPSSPDWIKQMSSSFSEGKEIVIGFSPYTKSKGFLNWFIRFEGFYTGLQYIGFALRKRAYMGVGRNMAYTKKLFFDNKGFASHHHLMAGDDDLFVRDTATKTNTAVQLSQDALTFSTPKNTFKTWWRQKKRHNFIGKFYNTGIKNSLASLHISHIFFYLSVGACFAFQVPWIIPVCMIAFRWLLNGLTAGLGFAKLQKDTYLAWGYPIFDFLMVWYLFVMGIVSFFAKKQKW